jgi:hypothetical protein
LSSVSQVASITGVCHWHPAINAFKREKNRIFKGMQKNISQQGQEPFVTTSFPSEKNQFQE